jgi:hypothetical protein
MKAALRTTYEVPKPRGYSVNAGGTFQARYDRATRELTWTLTFHDLTGPATAAHIHVGGFRAAGPVLVPLCAPCVSPASGTVTLTPAQARPLRPWYVNVHTSRNLSGEIRGQILGPTLPLTGPGPRPNRLCCPQG